MSAIFFFLVFIQYYLTVIFLKNREYNNFIILYIYSIFSYDFVFINAAYYLPASLVGLLKPYSEYLLIYFVINYFFVSKKRTDFFDKVDRYVVSYLIIPTVLIIMLDHCGSGNIYLRDSINCIRMYVLPVVLPYMFYRCNIFKHYKPQNIIYAIVGISIAIGIFGFYQKISFHGVHTLWFFDFFNREIQNPIAYGAANYVRNDTLRVTSFFVSPITYAITLSLTTLIIASILLNAKGNIRGNKMLWSVVLIFILYCQHNAQTRVGYIIDLIGLVVICYARFFKPSFRNIMLIPICVILFTVLFLISGLTKDESALGRLAQYRSFPYYFNILGDGFGSPFVNSYFDTYFMSLALLYGIFVFLPLTMLFKFNKYIYEIWQKNISDRSFTIAVIAISATFIYSFAFQYIAGSYPYRLYFLLLFLIFEYDRSLPETTGQTNNSRFIPGTHF